MFDMRTKTSSFVILALTCLLSSSSPALADSLAVEITSGAYVMNADSTEGRLLLMFDIPQEVTNAEIVFAELLIPLTSVIPDSSALMVYCHPLEINWRPDDVTWNDLGDSLGSGVIFPEGTLYATRNEGELEAYFDLTSIVRAWVSGEIENHGLVLFYESDRPPYFTFAADQNSRFGLVKLTYSH